MAAVKGFGPLWTWKWVDAQAGGGGWERAPRGGFCQWAMPRCDISPLLLCHHTQLNVPRLAAQLSLAWVSLAKICLLGSCRDRIPPSTPALSVELRMASGGQRGYPRARGGQWLIAPLAWPGNRGGGHAAASRRPCPAAGGNRAASRPLCKSPRGDWRAGGAARGSQAIRAGGEQCARSRLGGWCRRDPHRRATWAHRGLPPPSPMGLGVPLS